ncbi:MAG: OmpA family protein [Gammaproteobacteria bacterium]|nr:OmpA family protein [Gammaproteobacteria bacterium]
MKYRVISTAFICLLISACASKWSNTDLISEFERLNFETRQDERGVVVLVPDVFFEFGKFDLNDDAREKLVLIANVINNTKTDERQILVEGHTDSIGSDEYNMNLSRERAEAVTSELMFGNVRPDRIVTEWVGESKPIALNENEDGSDNPEGRELNRRVEIVVLNP